MSTLTYAVSDSVTMLRRQLKHLVRYPSLTGFLLVGPIVILLLFVYVFGGTLGDGLVGGVGVGEAAGGRAAYINYVVPGILLMGLATAGTGTAISVAMDMTEGIVARFRTMAIARVSVLTGHVIGSLIQIMLCVTVTTVVALLVGFRPNASVVEWLAAAGVLAMTGLAITWLCIALGLSAKGVESASNLPMPLMLLPFLGSGFVPTDSLPVGLRWFAEYQPFTPVMETIRGLLLGTSIGNSAIIATAWCAGITLLSYMWARKLYNRDPSR